LTGSRREARLWRSRADQSAMISCSCFLRISGSCEAGCCHEKWSPWSVYYSALSGRQTTPDI
jgi:hypothetical protein